MQLIKDKIIFKSKKDLVLIHLYIKCKEYKKVMPESHLEILYYLYEMGGISNKSDFNALVKTCLENTTLKKIDTVRNTLSFLISNNVILSDRNYDKHINPLYLPENTFGDSLGLDYKLMNNAVDEKTSL